MVIDFHVHCFPDDLALKAVQTLAQQAGIAAWSDGTIRSLKKLMGKAGISHSVVLPIATKPSQTEKINDWSAEIQDREIIAFGSIHPDYKDWKAELERIKEMGLKGIKLHPDYQLFFVDEQRMFPIYEHAFKLGLIVVFHAGVDIGLPAPYHCTPDRLSKVVGTFPGGRIIAAHMGGYAYWDDVERFLVAEDIYFDTSYSLGRISDGQAKRIIKNHGYKKILFATDSPWTEQMDELARIKRLGLDADVENAILTENARDLLRL